MDAAGLVWSWHSGGVKRWRVAGAATLAMAMGVAASPSATTNDLTTDVPAGDHTTATAAPDDAAQTAAATEAPTDLTQADVDAAMEAIRPVPMSDADLPPAAEPLTDGTPVDPAAVEQALADDLGSDWLGPRVAIDIRDASTGDVVLQRNVDDQMIPASLTKVVAGAAVAQSYPMDERFTTSVVAGPEPGDIVLVAGGDSLLSAERGDPHAVVGHAGLHDLAEQVAADLHADPAGDDTAATADPDATDTPDEETVRLYLDTSYAEGPSVTDGWTEFWVNEGYTGRITMLGLARDQGLPGSPSPTDPEQSTAQAFIDALEEFDVEVEWEDGDEIERLSDLGLPAVDLEDPDTVVLGEVHSAPARDVMNRAQLDSSNALTDQMVRIAAWHDGAGTDPEDVVAWMTEQIGEYGIDTTGMDLQNGSGLAEDAVMPARVVTDLLVLAGGEDHPELRELIVALPISGLSGTLHDRFHLERHQPGRGAVRAKTGALPGVTALAGTVVTAEDRVLVFTVIADDVDQDGPDIVEARAVVDQMLTDLAQCGC